LCRLIKKIKTHKAARSYIQVLVYATNCEFGDILAVVVHSRTVCH